MAYGRPYLLSGAGGPGFRRNVAPAVIALLLFLLLFSAGSYLVWLKVLRVRAPAPEAAPPAAATPAPLPAPVLDDLTVHVRNALSHLRQDMAAIRRAQQRMNLVMGALDRNYLGLEQRRLQSAHQLCEEGISHAAAAFEELRIADQQLSDKGGKP